MEDDSFPFGEAFVESIVDESKVSQDRDERRAKRPLPSSDSLNVHEPEWFLSHPLDNEPEVEQRVDDLSLEEDASSRQKRAAANRTGTAFDKISLEEGEQYGVRSAASRRRKCAMNLHYSKGDMPQCRAAIEGGYAKETSIWNTMPIWASKDAQDTEARTYVADQRYEEALVLLKDQKSLREGPHFSARLLHLKALLGAKRYSDAVAIAVDCLAYDSGSVQAWLGLSEALGRLVEKESAAGSILDRMENENRFEEGADAFNPSPKCLLLQQLSIVCFERAHTLSHEAAWRCEQVSHHEIAERIKASFFSKLESLQMSLFPHIVTPFMEHQRLCPRCQLVVETPSVYDKIHSQESQPQPMEMAGEAVSSSSSPSSVNPSYVLMLGRPTPWINIESKQEVIAVLMDPDGSGAARRMSLEEESVAKLCNKWIWKDLGSKHKRAQQQEKEEEEGDDA